MKPCPLKALAAAALGAWLAVSQAGCSFAGLDPKNLMSPPRANLEQQGIYELLQEDRQELTFVYPKRGEYRSAIIMRDWSGDGVNDAIGFILDERGVEVYFLEKSQDSWRTAASFVNTATQVDMVVFGDLDGNGQEDVLIGWGSASGSTGRTASAAAYLYRDGNVIQSLLGTYGEMTLTDFDGDGQCEVFTIDKYLAAEEEGAESSPALARVYAWQDGALKALYTANADNSIVNYSSIHFGKLEWNVSGVAVDGAKADGSMTTQVFTLEDGLLKNGPPGVNTEGYQNPFSRPSSAPFSSQDINGDGVLELPVVTRLPGLPQDAVLDSTSFLVAWTHYQSPGEYETAVSTLMNLGESYWFPLPEGLEGRISASNSTDSRTVTYTEVVTGEDGEQRLGSPLFTIRVFTRSAWDSRGETAGYEQLAVYGDQVYGIQILTKDPEYLQEIKRIQNQFHVTLA
ncbi:MAG: FG-GAP repeat domain-containing protein [Acutalibacter sp.]|jgi:hypothetical protein